MVCLGNICRSPLAEGILSNKLPTASYFIDSAGTAAYHVGNPPDPRSIVIAKKRGIDIQKQRARAFELVDFKRFDRIYVMDRSNYQNLQALQPSDKDWKKVALLLDTEEVPDPYYAGDDGFETVFDLIDTATDRIVTELKAHE